MWSPVRRDAVIAVVTLFYAVMLLPAWQPQFFNIERLSHVIERTGALRGKGGSRRVKAGQHYHLTLGMN